MTLKLGDRGPVVARWRTVMAAMFKGYAREVDVLAPGEEFGPRAVAWQKVYERNTGQPQDGEVSDADLAALKIVLPHRPIWCYTAPGSGAPWWLGPPFDLGEWCKNVLNLNHQPIDYPIGGYLGLMGGDPGTSYIEVVNSLIAELDRLLSINPDVNRALGKRVEDPHAVVDVELWFFGYSQSADALKQAVVQLFGDGGKYASIRDRINGLVLFGDPARRPGPTKVGNNPPGSGIARSTFPAWLEALVWDIVNTSPTPDFYACATDKIRPLFYEWFIRAETSLPFVIYTAQIIIPALLNLVAPFLANQPGLTGLSSPLAVPLLASTTGLPVNQLAPLIGGVLGSNEQPNPELIKLLSVQGVLTSLPDLIGLIGSLGGIAVHGDYYAPKAEFNGRSGLQVGCDIVAAFRR